MVTIERLTKHYGALVALDGLSLEVPPGEILAFVGPNGAGKTTALKVMVGLLSPTAGRVLIGGHDVHRQPLEAKRLLSFLPDQPFLYEALTLTEWVAFVGSVYAMDAATTAQRATSLLALFGLESLRAQRIGQLSYGMRSRLALATALLHEPKVLIMDEPFFGLDPQTLRLVKQLLRERAQQGMTVVLSTHQLGVVEDLAHRVAILSLGRVLALDALPALIRRYGATGFEHLFFHLTEPPRAA